MSADLIDSIVVWKNEVDYSTKRAIKLPMLWLRSKMPGSCHFPFLLLFINFGEFMLGKQRNTIRIVACFNFDFDKSFLGKFTSQLSQGKQQKTTVIFHSTKPFSLYIGTLFVDVSKVHSTKNFKRISK